MSSQEGGPHVNCKFSEIDQNFVNIYFKSFSRGTAPVVVKCVKYVTGGVEG